MAQDERHLLLSVVQELPEEQFQALKFLLEGQLLPGGILPGASRPELCRLLLQRCPRRALPVLGANLRQLGRHDLCQRFQLPLEEPIPTGVPNGAAPSATGNQQCPQTPGMPKDPGGSAPGDAPNPGGNARLLTEKDLLQIAQRLGKEWQQVGILCLGLEQSRLEQIQEENPGQPVLWSFQMLREWQRRQRQRGTAAQLRCQLEPLPLDPGILQLLRGLEGP
ncbi:hypothetical protein WISP_00904 [Willisornis vidua]|uniref:Death domain-containing protein n=1 Tax=Willisornis vidua TaxID=1566151 RepID=A0ABQ9DUX0_9PASS|nr:hypothetical protein WISP_00904 [Willisornis vidua]